MDDLPDGQIDAIFAGNVDALWDALDRADADPKKRPASRPQATRKSPSEPQ